MTARCVSMLAQLGETIGNEQLTIARDRLSAQDCKRRDGSWYGRWGLNYIYGTWSSLCALNACGVDPKSRGNPQSGRLAHLYSEFRRRVGRRWLELQARVSRPRTSRQHRITNGVGAARAHGQRRSRSSRGRARYTVPGAVHSSRMDSGMKSGSQPPGFPRVFYLRYHGYRKSFAMALCALSAI